MPSSINYGRNYVRIRDSDFAVLLNVLLDGLSGIQNDEWTDRVTERWMSIRGNRGFGCYDLDLEELISTPQERQRMLVVFDDAKRSLAARGATLSKDWLNSLPGREAIYFEDQQTRQYIGKLDEITRLFDLAGSADS
jgi:hypothetical protein